MRKLEPGKTNKEERMNFVEYWAEYVRTHPDREWSRQQNILIDGQIKNARTKAASTDSSRTHRP